MAITWVEVNRTSLRTASIAEREDTEVATDRTSAAVAAVQYLFRATNSSSLEYRINSELARMESDVYRHIPDGSSDGVLVYVLVSTATHDSTGVSASTFLAVGFVGPPYHFPDSSRALHYYRSRSSIGPSGTGVPSTRFFWGTRALDICI